MSSGLLFQYSWLYKLTFGLWILPQRNGFYSSEVCRGLKVWHSITKTQIIILNWELISKTWCIHAITSNIPLQIKMGLGRFVWNNLIHATSEVKYHWLSRIYLLSRKYYGIAASMTNGKHSSVQSVSILFCCCQLLGFGSIKSRRASTLPQEHSKLFYAWRANQIRPLLSNTIKTTTCLSQTLAHLIQHAKQICEITSLKYWILILLGRFKRMKQRKQGAQNILRCSSRKQLKKTTTLRT